MSLPSPKPRPPCTSWMNEQCNNPEANEIYGLNPSKGICQKCEFYQGEPRGLGDVIHTVLSLPVLREFVAAVKPKGCGCAKRRQDLNKI
jgi:hypothetical protein